MLSAVHGPVRHRGEMAPGWKPSQTVSATPLSPRRDLLRILFLLFNKFQSGFELTRTDPVWFVQKIDRIGSVRLSGPWWRTQIWIRDWVRQLQMEYGAPFSKQGSKWAFGSGLGPQTQAAFSDQAGSGGQLGPGRLVGPEGSGLHAGRRWLFRVPAMAAADDGQLR